MTLIERVRLVLSNVLGHDPAEIQEDFSMDSCSNWDSLRHMNIILALEKEFKCEFPDDDVANITSLKLICLVLEDLGVD